MKTTDNPTFLDKFSPANVQFYRKLVQYLFLTNIILIGIKFAVFVNQLDR